ncbi:hypothetical protein EIN_335210 [Entamoeba invadens IP1]|uniref:t-SNARE coiled-coil homology domain-containing protein n=1 Tax=Entamoeba invadens IP1 TaxID=370355 RepID=L7FM07_ENTIV|nr:hypothetical protein EIN_335210 [Entamoeba invadens IP1]ELP88549.1 hypothetical protein EIN_335210 [Entamoeba invadens IP1]|eukprot:XP_004255320.1 hypothetical protein EIN_335210 [Entamoeba invadens IP1]
MSRQREPHDEELDVNDDAMNVENEERIGSLTDSISRLKVSANYLNDTVIDDGRRISSMESQMDSMFEYLGATRERLKRLFGEVGMGHLLVLAVGAIVIFIVIYIIAFKL